MSDAYLVGGARVTTDSAAWRDECLARHVLALPFERRARWLCDFEERHGNTRAVDLRSTMRAVSDARPRGVAR